MARALRGRFEPSDHFVLGHPSTLELLSALRSPVARTRFKPLIYLNGLVSGPEGAWLGEAIGRQRRQVRLLKGQIDDRRFDLVRDLIPDPPRSRLAIHQSFDPALLVSAIPVVERRSRDPDWSQCPAD